MTLPTEEEFEFWKSQITFNDKNRHQAIQQATDILRSAITNTYACEINADRQKELEALTYEEFAEFY